MSELSLFEKNTVTRKTKYGYEVKCKKGLWGVEAPTKAEATQQGVHYFMQYLGDGEYS